MAKYGGDGVILESGREFYANCSIVGIDERGVVWEGYDGGVHTDGMTAAERRDLADLMIERWNAFAEVGPQERKTDDEEEE